MKRNVPGSPGLRMARLALTAALAAVPAPAPLHADDAPPRKTVVAGPEYAASGAHRLLFGADYRKAWTTPVSLEILDLQKEGGGLTPLRRTGGQQTKGLALTGKDGKNYSFRGIYKDASELVDEELRGTVVERTLQDAMSAQHPASELIAGSLLDSLGIPRQPWKLVVMPDDPALGEFRKDFALAIGTFGEYPSEKSATNPGFQGITELVSHKKLYEKLEAGDGDQADVQAFLRARLVDIFIGDWDRHRKQWRWAKFPGNPLWTPIPEDRDQAFSRYQGFVVGLARGRDPRFQDFGSHYAGINGLTSNGSEQDRRLLVGFTREDFQKTAQELGVALSDDVLKRAVDAMPPEWAKLDAARLFAEMKARREGLPKIADAYYFHLAHRVDVYMTNKAEHVDVKRSPSGDTDVSVAMLGADGQPQTPYFRRVFHPRETDEVRLYALGGDDSVVVTGGNAGPIVRVIGGTGNDRLDARAGGNTRLSDSKGVNHAEGASLDDREYVPPPPPKNAPWIPPLDWGSATFFTPWVSYNGDTGAFLGLGMEHRAFGFRKDPWAARQTVRAGYAFGEQSGKLEYTGDFRRENATSFFGLHAYASGVEVLRFYGFGNETENVGDSDFYRAKANQLLLFPSFNVKLGHRGLLVFGPAAKYTSTKHGADNQDELVNVSRPYGSGDFGEVGAHTALAFDGRDSDAFPRHGVFLAVRGTVCPKVWDVTKAFGQMNGNANAYLSAGKWLTLGLRAGAKKVFGEYPYMEAATIGGGSLGTPALAEPDYTVRGFRARRFSGDSAAYGNADLRLTISKITLILPGHFGVFGFTDTGRVWLEGENSDTWHTGVGGGLWLSFLNYKNTLSVGLAHSNEEDLVYVKGGFTF
jgi:hypothetical protein